MTVREARTKAVRLLSSAEVSKQISPTPALDADCILCAILHTNRSFLLAHDDTMLPASKEKRFFKHISQRQQGLPVAYITGHKEFFGFDFCVSPAVLIPKPDTELLVECALSEIEQRTAGIQKNGSAENTAEKSKPDSDTPPFYLADICTGSGCVIVSILKTLEQKHPDVFKNIRLICDASDISAAALKVARKNAERLLERSFKKEVRFFRRSLIELSDPAFLHLKSGTHLFRNIFFPKRSSEPYAGRVPRARYNMIVSNPPYIPSQTAAELLKDGRNEPLLALDGGTDGTDILRPLIGQAYYALQNGGVLLVETGEYNAACTRKLMTKTGFTDIVTYNDLGGLPRVTRALKAQ